MSSEGGLQMDVFLALAIFGMMTKPVADQTQVNSQESIRILPVSKTPESNTVILALAVPQNGDVKKNPLWIQFRLDGYSLGTESNFDRADEVNVSRLGQTVHVVIDDLPYLAINNPAIDPFNEEGFYYDTSYKFELPYTLKSGLHTIRMFPARSYGESLKGEKTFDAIYFYIGERTDQEEVDLSRPYITYNEPSDQIPFFENKPLLLDFYLTNCKLTSDGYQVRLTIDGKIKRSLTSWEPYYIYGLKRGKHTIRLELIDPKGNLVPGPFNDVKRTIHVQG